MNNTKNIILEYSIIVAIDFWIGGRGRSHSLYAEVSLTAVVSIFRFEFLVKE